MTDTTITTRVALAVIDVNLTAVTSETNRAYTSKRVDQIVAYTTIQAWIQLTLVNVNLTLCARETCNSAHFSTYCYHQWRNHCNPKWIQVLQLNQIYRVLILSTVTSCPKCHSFTERASHKLLSLHKKPKLFFIYPHYQLPHKRILFEKLLPVQLVTKSLAFYGTHKFLAAFTRACQWSTAWVGRVLSTPPHPFLTTLPVVYSLTGTSPVHNPTPFPYNPASGLQPEWDESCPHPHTLSLQSTTVTPPFYDWMPTDFFSASCMMNFLSAMHANYLLCQCSCLFWQLLQNM
jgi:hypothetical protein